jgi:hypothetical protein
MMGTSINRELLHQSEADASVGLVLYTMRWGAAALIDHLEHTLAAGGSNQIVRNIEDLFSANVIVSPDSTTL